MEKFMKQNKIFAYLISYKWIFESLIFILLLSRALLYWQVNTITVIYASFVIMLAILILFQWKKAIPYLKFALIAYTILEYGVFTRSVWQQLLPNTIFFRYIFGSSNNESIFGFLGISLLILSCSFSMGEILHTLKLTKLNNIKMTFSPGFILLVNILISFVLSSYYALLLYLKHGSFGSSVFDFGIFDQAIYTISTGNVTSTTRQFTNIFFDHQHFSISILSPLYLFGKGFQGYLLNIITPFLLIFIPSLLLYLTANNLTMLIHKKKQKLYWLIGFTSLLLWLHPYTQSAVLFQFHEKYLMPSVFSALLLATSKYLLYPRKDNFLLVLIPIILWLGIKEDQWLFIFVFGIQFMLLTKLLLKKVYIRLSSAMLILPILYALFLLWFNSQAKNVYGGLYSNLSTTLKSFFTNGNLIELIQNLNLNEGVNIYLFQKLFTFDMLGVVFLPLSILGNYAERVLADSYAIKNPVFHYGVDVPIYSAVSILLLVIMSNHRFKSKFSPAAIVVCIYIFSFGSVLGWNNIYYAIPTLPTYLNSYNLQTQEREGFYEIISRIPDNESIVASDGYATHLTARGKIAQWPEPIVLPNGAAGKNDLYSYNYWLLRKSIPLTDEMTNNLLNKNYTIVSENQHSILLKKV
jgi:uncharacterized membrane protein